MNWEWFQLIHMDGIVIKIRTNLLLLFVKPENLKFPKQQLYPSSSEGYGTEWIVQPSSQRRRAIGTAEAGAARSAATVATNTYRRRDRQFSRILYGHRFRFLHVFPNFFFEKNTKSNSLIEFTDRIIEIHIFIDPC